MATRLFSKQAMRVRFSHAALPGGVIGNTKDSGSFVPRSSRGRGIFMHLWLDWIRASVYEAEG